MIQQFDLHSRSKSLRLVMSGGVLGQRSGSHLGSLATASMETRTDYSARGSTTLGSKPIPVVPPQMALFSVNPPKWRRVPPALVLPPERSLKRMDRWASNVQPPAESGLLPDFYLLLQLFTSRKENSGQEDFLVLNTH